MEAILALSQRGWRRTGAVNVVLASGCGLVLLVCMIVSVVNQQTSVNLGTTRIFMGRCYHASVISTILHLGLNIISTGILASSNFFMQIVTSPSRSEIDRSHQFLRSLQIGLQSPRNIPHLSRMKQVCWLILLFSSIPIHLFFNSSVYKTAYQNRNWNLTIATEYFAYSGIENQTYWIPGASLATSGTSSPAQRLWNYSDYLQSPSGIYNSSSSGEYNDSLQTAFSDMELSLMGFGEYIIPDVYWSSSIETARKSISSMAINSTNWSNLSSESCMAEYRPLKYHTEYKDLLMVVDGGATTPQGWKRDQVFDFALNSNLSNLWDPRVPQNELNSLWFWTNCKVDEYSQSPETDGEMYLHTCGRIFGFNTSTPLLSTTSEQATLLSFLNNGNEALTTASELAQGYEAHNEARTLQIKYCLAEPTTCQVGVSNALILIVIICVLLKVVTCIFILSKLQEDSLVTPGDAIESFLAVPDPNTQGLGTLGLSEAQALEFGPRKIYSSDLHPELTSRIRPRRWFTKSHRLHSAVPRGIWVQVYYPGFLALAALLIGVVFSSSSGLGSFGPSENSDILDIWGSSSPGYLAILIIINVPQVILSFIYLTINTLHTQLRVEQEWNSYASSYKSLRVSYPRGKQTSTYRLQLPYKYSIPLIFTSTMLHWLVSNSLYLLIVEGEFENGTSLKGMAESFNVSPDATIAIGYSGMSTLIFFCASIVFVLSPFFFRYRKLKNDMVLGGTNSLVLSAACHVPPILRNSEETNAKTHLMSHEDIDTEEYLKNLARNKLRWGAMSLPQDSVGEIFVEDSEPIMHLGFGGEEHEIHAPKTGALYV